MSADTSPFPADPALAAVRDLPVLDEDGIDRLLAASGGAAVLFFSGLKQKRIETADVAVILRECLRRYRGTVAAALVAPAAEDRIKTRFGVVVFPSLVFVQGGRTAEILPRIQDWPVYAERFALHFGPAPVLAAE